MRDAARPSKGKAGLCRRIAWAALLLCAASGQALGQPIREAELEDSSFDAEIVRLQMVKRENSDHIIPITVRQKWTVKWSSGRQIGMQVLTTSYSARGTRRSESVASVFRLDEVKDVESRGGGKAMWTFQDDTLSFIRTFSAGAFRMRIAISRGVPGYACKAKAAFARENGDGLIELIGLFGASITVVRAAQISSECRVVGKI